MKRFLTFATCVFTLVSVSFGSEGAGGAQSVEALQRQGVSVRLNADGQVIVLDARKAAITGQTLRDFPFLRDLKLTGPQVTDDTLTYLDTFAALTSLALDKTAITDWTLAEKVARLPRLQQLFLAETRVTDTGVAALELAQFTRLRLAGTQITDRTLEMLGECRQLQSLDVSNTGVTSAGAAYLLSAGKLTDVNFYSTRVDDAACDTFADMTQLARLNLDDTAVTDAGVAKLVGLQNLEFLHLGRTTVSDAAIPHLLRLRGLKTLHVTRSRVTPAGASRLVDGLPGCSVVWQVEE